MATAWDHLGEIANVAQLSGIDAVRLIGMIIQAASTARLHKNNCKQFAMHLRLIGNLLDQLKISELKKYPETREPLEQLEDALRRSYILVNSCQVRSYLYLLAMGWTIVYQFRKAQDEIDRYLKIIPLISLVNNARVRERLEYIEMDRHEYTLDDEDRKVQEVIMNPDPFNTDVSVLRRSFSYSYPDLPFNEVIKKENEKLHFELQRSQSCLDASQSEIIQNFMEIAHVFASDHQCEDMPYYPYASRNQVHENSNDMQIVVHSASYSQDQNDYDMPYYSYVSSNQEHENSNGMQIIVHSDSNSQFERAIPYYPYVSSQQEDENRNDLQMIVHSASNTQFEKAIPYYPYVSSNQEHEKSNDAQIIVRSASNSKFAKAIPYYPDVSSKQERENSSDLQIGVRSALRSTSSTSSRQDLLSSRRIHRHEEWHSGPLGCCSEPMMCVKTLLFPCGTLSKIATAATNRHMTSADACNELLAYSLIASCCCYTCCIRMKLRNALNIRGGWCNDFLLHFCCCCCALVQELREIEIRGIHGPLKTKTSPPSCQYMES
ncbi:putative PLAC8 motif-containing protein [Helianthus annuus]|uniref:PLAC8 motif-containing protein n=1 Tax=Helianthus annuus TaxID=4232 RepID=A0A9K3N8B3_HELAN|nr:protein MID1-COMPLEMENTING ACTIVITY 1 [Helianthus annuus]KAF5790911.1 putative PLAC8 motif-containing protein [Helianthus annuus]KAJ0526065.1 putative PLAC8 motif-containing protein [Helianthus annuus]KAJ0707502.1 putative PLAC8 motif-containing protein [Helianthus annuus]